MYERTFHHLEAPFGLLSDCSFLPYSSQYLSSTGGTCSFIEELRIPSVNLPCLSGSIHHSCGIPGAKDPTSSPIRDNPPCGIPNLLTYPIRWAGSYHLRMY